MPVPPMMPPTVPSRLLPVTTASGRPIGPSRLSPEPGSMAQEEGSSPSLVSTMLSKATGVSGAAAGGSSGALGGSFGALKVLGSGGGFTGSGSAGSSGSGDSSSGSGSATSGSSSMIATATTLSGSSMPDPMGASGISSEKQGVCCDRQHDPSCFERPGVAVSRRLDIGSAAALVSVRFPRGAR